MNNSFYDDIDTNFEKAYKMCEENFSHEELINLLKNGNIPERQIAAMKFDNITTIEDANAILSNLTGCDGKIREAAALTLKRILSDSLISREILSKISFKTLADATIDINGNICRLAIDSAILLKESKTFSKNYVSQILIYAKEAFDTIDKFIFRDKKYVINKQIFKLYWCLEALNYFYDEISDDILENVLKQASEQKEYTIREKAANIIISANKFPALADKLKNDENYYVRNVFTH